MKKVLIIGGGLAGLSLATELVDEDFDVTVIERKPYLGGRASNASDPSTHDPLPIGPHVFVTAYNNLRRFFHKIGAKDTITWEHKIFLESVFSGTHNRWDVSRLPVSLYLFPWIIFYKFISFKDKVSNIKAGMYMKFFSMKHLKELDHQDAYSFLRSHGVTENAIDKFWNFIVMSLLNVPIDKCSAAELCILLNHWSHLHHRKFGFAKHGLGDIYTTAARNYIEKRGGKIVTHSTVRSFILDGDTIKELEAEVNGQFKKYQADIVVSTLNPLDLYAILPGEISEKPFFSKLKKFEPVPYISVHLWFDRKITRKQFWALVATRDRKYMNTDFYDQSNIYMPHNSRSYITSNIIFSKQYEHLTDKEIVDRSIEELKVAIPHHHGVLVHSHVRRIPYVIYAPYPGMSQYKLSQKTPIRNFYLAGDWTSDMTQCMEAAVRSGYQCAELILKDFGVDKKIYNPVLD